jgi:hypothetical protein
MRLANNHPTAMRIDEHQSKEYVGAMSTEQLKQEVMSLPIAEKVLLAQALWESINAGLVDTDEKAGLREAAHRDEELSSGTASGRTHEQVMQAARRALGCD